LPKNGLFKIGPDDLLYHLVFFNTFEELKLPIKGPMEDAGVIKLYEPSPTPCLYVAPVENITGRVPFSPCFWRATPLRQFLTVTASARIQASQWAVPTLRRWMAGVAAMYMRSTHGCGSLDGASLDWVDSMWRKQLRDRRLPEMKDSSVDWRLVDNGRQKALDSE
jgi:hypothetical protein